MEKGINVYSTMSGTKAAFAERAIQSLKEIKDCCIENHGKEFVLKMDQFCS